MTTIRAWATSGGHQRGLPLAQHQAQAALGSYARERRKGGEDMSKELPEQHSLKAKGMLPNSRFPLLVHRGGIPGGGGRRCSSGSGRTAG